MDVMRRDKNKLAKLFVAAIAVRVAYWLLGPPAAASDSGAFLGAARAVANGDWSRLAEYPFHALYSLLLVPAYWNGEHVRSYVAVLHITLSAATVVLIAIVAAEMTSDESAPFIAGAAATVYPTALFWMPYILTETAFVFTLLAFAWSTIDALRRPVGGSLVRTVVIGAVLFFLRPVAVAIVACGVSAAALAIAGATSPRRVVAARWAAAIIVAIAAAAPFATATTRDRFVRIPTIGQTLWLSTTVVHGTQAELAAAATPPGPPTLSSGDQYALKARTAVEFMSAHPFRYLSMAARRFVAFWVPALYLDWSPRHRLIDVGITVPLIIAACCAIAVGGRRDAWLVMIGYAMLLALESAFGQIDADARYRFPAEVLLIAPAAVTVSALLRRASAAPAPARNASI